ncbi:hypothetical protein GF358_00975 [Candidatus Woesearchaeota archaeon]|nr:hypothetical protein [Candidatus Woesearchaeota archaeon]
MPKKSKYKIAIEEATGENIEGILRAILPRKALRDLGRKRLRIDESHAVIPMDKNKRILRYTFSQGAIF